MASLLAAVALTAPAPRIEAPSQLQQRLRPLLHLAARPGGGETHRARVRIGRSSLGRPIRLREWVGAGWPERPRILAVGCIHGDECAGTKVLRFMPPGGCPPAKALWAIPNLNPDGFALGTRLNGRGVDLNRNFPSGWQPIGQRYDLEYSGPRPLSEPETRLAARLIRALRPKVTIWFHQEAHPMVRAWGPSVAAARRYARAAELPFRRLPWLAGTAPNWQNHRFPHTASFVVELPQGPLSDLDAQRDAAAVFATLATHRPRAK